MEIKTKNIINFFEKEFSSKSRQYEWDSNGIQLLVHDKKISKIAFALDPTEDSIDYAIKMGCELLITHHPIFFRPIKQIDFSSVVGNKIIKCIKNELNLLSYHTVLDRADYSLNDYIAEKISAEVISGFTDFGQEPYYKFVVFVPKGYETKIIDAIDAAGGGKIGNYSKCTFYTEGTGTFLPGENTSPFLGEIGKLEEANEYRLETIVKGKNLQKLIDAVLSVHPYEEVAYDVYKLEMGDEYSLGRICKFNKEMPLNDFLKILAEKLNIENIRHNQESEDIKFSKFAIVTGSGASLWKECLKSGVTVLLTSDMKYHDAVDAYEHGVTIVDIGHFESETIFMKYIADIVAKKFSIETLYYENKCKIKSWRHNNA
ncbi:Nif3-like dinuclear metal center hexameric protein [Deferribacter autotrophicus]|uniref:GTP cyclohydrolase 1 type 2 homolog n=1 Tax=Deferribacter autotrophicus TaxID=500465 RepID=A0A5A8F5M0_9BACT|nr:Nif3-like dinuclear metal center hexameric protein [Deferribacter autotrophicus]KAA0259426.1 Nif3-like dinuclear metal center hexameric protein [Deferribacter autotrophicus]